MGSLYYADKTMLAIDRAIEEDQGAAFRRLLGQVLPHIGDAYSDDTFPFRSHMGASGIGKECARMIWYGWRWTTMPKFPGRVLRLFNRGHLEEGRFIAMLLMIGVQVYQQDENGKQFRISAGDGHFGGSGDGVGIGLPDLDPGVPALLEFKTSAESKFKEIAAKGVREAVFEYYVQVQIYMTKMGLPISLHQTVNKNNDDIYAELIPVNTEIGEQFIDRGEKLVKLDGPPDKLKNASIGFYKCKFCDHKDVCHGKQAPVKTCRSCQYGMPVENGEWVCGKHGMALSKEDQFAGCGDYILLKGFN